jgi:hypothetical protein
MIYNFDTEQHAAAIAALVVYAIYRSRDKRKFKVTPEMWGQIDRFTKSSAKRARNIPQFIDALMPKLCCPSINPRWMQVAITGEIGVMTLYADSQRQFLTGILEGEHTSEVLHALYKETTFIILLVRDRLEREKPIESKFNIEEESL